MGIETKTLQTCNYFLRLLLRSISRIYPTCSTRVSVARVRNSNDLAAGGRHEIPPMAPTHAAISQPKFHDRFVTASGRKKRNENDKRRVIDTGSWESRGVRVESGVRVYTSSRDEGRIRDVWTWSIPVFFHSWWLQFAMVTKGESHTNFWPLPAEITIDKLLRDSSLTYTRNWYDEFTTSNRMQSLARLVGPLS